MMGGVPHSDIIQDCRIHITLWNAALTKKKGCEYSSNKLKRLERRCKKYNTQLHSEEFITAELYKAKKRYKQKKKEAGKLRLKFLEDKALAIAEEGNLELSAVYQRLIKTEQQRTAARKIKWALGKMSTGPTSSVDVINNGERISVTQKEQLEQVCMNSIRKKYVQTNNTPCMKEPLKTMLGLGH